jgi:hypothetical protein
MAKSKTSVLGFRIEPSRLHWAFVKGSIEQPILESAEVVAAPKTYEEGEALVWYRQRVNHLLDQYEPTIVAIRYPEAYAPKRQGAVTSSQRRARIEGVVLEAASSRNIETFTASLVTISSKFGVKSAKDFLEVEDLRGLDWSKYKKGETREAILVAAAAFENDAD